MGGAINYGVGIFYRWMISLYSNIGFYCRIPLALCIARIRDKLDAIMLVHSKSMFSCAKYTRLLPIKGNTCTMERDIKYWSSMMQSESKSMLFLLCQIYSVAAYKREYVDDGTISTLNICSVYKERRHTQRCAHIVLFLFLRFSQCSWTRCHYLCQSHVSSSVRRWDIQYTSLTTELSLQPIKSPLGSSSVMTPTARWDWRLSPTRGHSWW